MDVAGLGLGEVGAEQHRRLGWRGGFPVPYLAKTDEQARQRQDDMERTVIERDLAQWGVTDKTARQYLDALAATFLVRPLPPWFKNRGKRHVKAPKVYIRDSGMLHGLLHLPSPQRLDEHPKLGASWEGFALEQVLQITGDRDAYFWATHGGAERDLMVFWQGRRVGFEFKFGDAPGITISMRVAMADLKLDRLLVVVPGKESYHLGPKMEVGSILHLVERLGRMAQELKE